MEDLEQAFDEIAALMDSRGMETKEATLVALLMRKPARAAAFKEWLEMNPNATDKEVWEKANQIAKTVEPTRHRIPEK